MNSFFVIGSINMDMVVKVPHFPVAGETLITQSPLQTLPGGKGANQVVALARLGNTVEMFGALGKDQFGEEYLRVFEKESVVTNHIAIRKEHSTGIALIEVEESGQNRIVVVPGANSSVDTQYIDSICTNIIASATHGHITVLLQMEIPAESVFHCLEILGPIQTITCILDPAPAQSIPTHIYQHIDYITPNETEAHILTGIEIHNSDNAEKAGALLLKRGCKNVIIKAGKEGAYLITSNALNDASTQITHMPPKINVHAIDSTAAGDSFNAGFAHALQHGKTVLEAIAFANRVAGLATTKHGAQSAMPKLPLDAV